MNREGWLVYCRLHLALNEACNQVFVGCMMSVEPTHVSHWPTADVCVSCANEDTFELRREQVSKKRVTCFLPRYLRPVHGTRICNATGVDCRMSPAGTAGWTAGNSACGILLLGRPPCAKVPGRAHGKSSKEDERFSSFLCGRVWVNGYFLAYLMPQGACGGVPCTVRCD